MNLFHLLLPAIFIFSSDAKPKFDILLPEGYVIETTSDEYNLLSASKYIDDEIVGMIEIRYSDDWSFSTFSNQTYMAQVMEGNDLEQASAMMFDNFKVILKEQSYLNGVGDCVSVIYSGDYYANGVRVTNAVFQFVKNDQLFTLTGSSFPETFSSEYKSFLKSFDTFKL
jgi:hypothetical protein